MSAAPTGPSICVLLRRLRSGPKRVADDEVMGGCERAALASALTLRAELEGTVTAVALGPPKREDRVLAMALRAGCDRAIRVGGSSLEGVDYLGVAIALARAVDEIGFDLVVCGDRSQDEGQGATGPAVAHELGVPHLSGLVDVRGEGDRVVAVRRAGGARHELSCALPAVLCMASFSPSRRPPEGEAGPRGGAIEELGLDALELDARQLAHRKRLTGTARASRRGTNATILPDATELAARLASKRVLG